MILCINITTLITAHLQTHCMQTLRDQLFRAGSHDWWDFYFFKNSIWVLVMSQRPPRCSPWNVFKWYWTWNTQKYTDIISTQIIRVSQKHQSTNTVERASYGTLSLPVKVLRFWCFSETHDQPFYKSSKQYIGGFWGFFALQFSCPG